MRPFNVAVVAAWLAMFALSLHTTPETPDGFLDNAVLLFNEQVTDICYSCGQPSLPVANYDPKATGDSKYSLATDLALVDSRMTNVILINTFPFVVFVMAMINLAYYFGTGAIGRHFDTGIREFNRGWASVWRRKSEEKDETPPKTERVATES